MSATGRHVVYEDGTLNPIGLQFPYTTRHDVETGLSETVGGGFNGSGGGGALDPSISDNGRFVSFTTLRVAGGPTGFTVPSVAIRDMNAGGGTVVVADPASASALSGDGTWVAYLVDLLDDSPTQVFVENRVTGQTQQASIGSAGAAGNGSSSEPTISGNGRYVGYSSVATNLVADGTNAATQVYVRDRVAGRTQLVSRNALGVVGQGDSSASDFADDGGSVVFQSLAANLADDDQSGWTDVFIRAFPTPSVTSLAPNALSRGAITTLMITGHDFRAPASVGVAGGQGVTFGPATVVASTTIQVAVTVAGNAPIGPRTVVVSNLGTGPGPKSLAAAARTCITVA